MKKSFFLLSILAAISVVAAEAPAAQAAFGAGDNIAVPDNFAFDSSSQPVLNGETFHFQTEVSRLMNIVINSLYKTPEIFLRELISNGSDALDKIRFQSLTDPSALESNPNLNVTIAVHKDQRVITITDTGVGMTKEELQKNLGTIAKSGTSEFIETMSGDTADMDLIGKFGVGFYSVFLVADKVRVTSKSNRDDQYIWESTAVDDFTIAKDPAGNTLGRGTQIAIHLKEGQDQYLDDSRIQGLVTKYSEFINFPIYLRRTKTKTVEAEVEPAKEPEAKEEESEDSEEAAVEEEKVEEVKEKAPPVTVTYQEDDLMNSNKPIWIREPKSVTPEEYDAFYSVLTKETGSKPMAYSHFKAEGDVEFKGIMYIPAKAPKDLFQRVDGVLSNVKLYVKRVFITDDSAEFLPRWLSFLKVVVDAEDAPLNVSRETVQSNKSIKSIHKHLVKKMFDLLKTLSQDEEKYAGFIKEFGTSLKLGALEDKSNVKKISRLLRYRTSEHEKYTSLEDYVSRMKKGQKDIFYFTGANIEEIKQSPFVESLLARGYEVLYMDDPVDEIVLNQLANFEGKKFQNVGKSDLNLGDENAAVTERELETKFASLLDWLHATLLNDVEKVRISKRLTTSPAALVANDFGWTANMERLMDGQAKQNKDDAMHQFMKNQKKILEINPGHPLILGMLERSDKDPKGFEQDLQFQEMAKILYDITLVRSGYNLKEGVKPFAGRVENMLRVNLGVDTNAEAQFEVEKAEARDQEEVEAEVEKREDLLDADEPKPGMISPEELNRMMKEFTDSTNPPMPKAGEKVNVNVEELVAEVEQELDSESTEDTNKEAVHDEL
ncbi:molecular chaperone HtpG [Entomortierella parvispora]|uniref:Molecular chaperone HtpG n=1 Tax=Entomortierella parvispora TaxID=205924 RepID=A0A9P3HCW9_9FUNG|nr:molecular chaperone HtpG [Entomortierella parvispora]